jgi:hypothetical protein
MVVVADPPRVAVPEVEESDRAMVGVGGGVTGPESPPPPQAARATASSAERRRVMMVVEGDEEGKICHRIFQLS